MAKQKQVPAPAAEELKDPVPTQEPAAEAPVEVTEAPAVEPQEPAEVVEQPVQGGGLVTVRSLTPTSLRQPSSGWFIAGYEERELLNDGWLRNQLRARLLQLV